MPNGMLNNILYSAMQWNLSVTTFGKMSRRPDGITP